MRILTTFTLAVVTMAAPALAQPKYPFQDPALDPEKRIDNAISLLTLDEKIAGLGASGVESARLGIRKMDIGEALSGVVLGGPMSTLVEAFPGAPAELRMQPTPTTQFSQGVGFGRTWDPDLVRKAGDVIGSEARYIFENGKNPKAFLVLLTPNADLARDPRWGRTQESYGEDPLLNGTLAAALIHGIQGGDPKHWQAASLVKHFLANSNEEGRYGSTSDFDVRLLREYYSMPFRMAFVEGGARSFMASYNAWNKVPMTVNPILRDIAMKEWGVDGIVCTDAGSLGNLVGQHKYYPDLKHAAAASIKAGINMYLAILENYKVAVKGALDDKLLSEAEIDAALRGSLRTGIRLGLLDAPGASPFAKLKGAPDPVNSPAHNAIAKQVALESVVLLKNSNGMLPLDRKALKSVAVIGPLADAVLPDFYGGVPPYTVTPLAAIKQKVGPGVTVTYAADDSNGVAVKAAQASDTAIVVVGNHPTCHRTPQKLLQGLMASVAACDDPSEGMEGSDRKSLTLTQEELIQKVYKANPKTIVVLISSAPYAINWTQENIPAILHTSHNGQDEGSAIADVLFGDYNPAGRLVHTWVSSVDQLPPMMDYNIRHGRTYLYFKGKPLYPFGYGLSYTTFQYSRLRISAPSLPKRGEVEVAVDITNTGTRDGDEVMQVYVGFSGSKVARPLKQLTGFKRVSIPSGRTRTVWVPLKGSALAYWDETQNGWLTETGPVQVFVGGSSADERLSTSIRVE
jgi:beta-glucosidase